MINLKVPERGSTEISSAVWKALSRTDSLWALANRHIVTVEQLRNGGARLKAGPFVGRAVIDSGVTLEIHEKVKGSLASLLRYARTSDFKISPTLGPSSEIGSLISVLISQFLACVRRYASRGRDFAYRRRRSHGSLAGGRLDMTRTLGLRARGLHHLMAFDRNEVSFNLPENRVILSALREVERIRAVIPIPQELVTNARSMALIFDDCRSVDVMFGARREAVQIAQRLSSNAGNQEIGDMLALAAMLLGHRSIEAGSTYESVAPRSWFLNLETLFEDAARECLRRNIHQNYQLLSARDEPRLIFRDVSDRYTANPDYVMSQTGGVLVGDAKYKTWTGEPSSADVYQLLVHASAFGATRAFLVFPAERFEALDLGSAVTGTSVTAFAVRATSLEADIRQLLDSFGLAGDSLGSDVAA